MEECMFIKADEIRRLLGISRSKAYQIIRELNAELKSQGYMVLNGKVNSVSIVEILKKIGFPINWTDILDL